VRFNSHNCAKAELCDRNCDAVCLSVCHPVSRITHERVYGCRPNMVGMAWAKDDPLELVKFWCSSKSECRFWLTFPFPSHFEMGGLTRFLGISHIVTSRFFIKTGEQTDADKLINLQHFGSDPVDVQIQIRVNPEIRIRIPDHFW